MMTMTDYDSQFPTVKTEIVEGEQCPECGCELIKRIIGDRDNTLFCTNSNCSCQDGYTWKIV